MRSTSPPRLPGAAAAPLGVVADVLRSTSTFAQALAAGYRGLTGCRVIEEPPESLVGTASAGRS